MKIKETNSTPLASGIFNTIYTKYGSTFEWLSESDSHTIDMMYYLNHSGDRTISPLFQSLLDMEESGSITSALDLIADAIVLMYKDQWNRLYDAYITKTYDPIENYSMVEDENIGSKITNSRSTSTGSYGFNSNDAVPTDTGSESSTTTGAYNDNVRKLTRSGNVGVTTSQQMIQSEIDLRKWVFYGNIMSDVDRMITLSVYEY